MGNGRDSGKGLWRDVGEHVDVVPPPVFVGVRGCGAVQRVPPQTLQATAEAFKAHGLGGFQLKGVDAHAEAAECQCTGKNVVVHASSAEVVERVLLREAHGKVTWTLWRRRRWWRHGGV